VNEIVAVAWLHGGMWIAECPRPFCGNAEMFGQCRDGTVGGLSGASFRCRIEYGGCGLVCRAEWPPNMADIEALVMPRPVPATRNWLPGESLHDLLAENLEHGLIPTDVLTGGPTRKLLEIIGDEVTVGRRLGFADHAAIERR